MTWTEQKYMGMGWYVSVNTETYEESWVTITGYEKDFTQTVAKSPEEFTKRLEILGINTELRS